MEHILDASECTNDIGNKWCTGEYYLDAPFLCNMTWHKETVDQFCLPSLYHNLTIGKIVERQTWPSSIPADKLQGFLKLWEIHSDMLQHLPDFHLYIANPYNGTTTAYMAHSSVFAETWLDTAREAKINHAGYHTHYLNMMPTTAETISTQQYVYDGDGDTVFGVFEWYYYSSFDWRGLPQVSSFNPISIESLVLFACKAVGNTCLF